MIRSERKSASSTSWVTMSAVFWSRCHKIQQHLLQLVAGERVQHAERFVQQQHLGLQRERPGNAAALAHALGEFRRTPLHGVARADQREVVFGDLTALADRGGVVHLVDAEQDILEGRSAMGAGRATENHAAIRTSASDLLAREDDSTGGDIG
jgi:hypothetical protein